MMRVAILSAAIAAANAAAVPSWSTPASVSESDTYDFCANANPTNCGGQFTDSAGVLRSFDLSSMCQTDGGGYYSEDHGNGKEKDGSGHEYTANVCGNLADECPAGVSASPCSIACASPRRLCARSARGTGARALLAQSEA